MLHSLWLKPIDGVAKKGIYLNDVALTKQRNIRAQDRDPPHNSYNLVVDYDINGQPTRGPNMKGFFPQTIQGKTGLPVRAYAVNPSGSPPLRPGQVMEVKLLGGAVFDIEGSSSPHWRMLCISLFDPVAAKASSPVDIDPMLAQSALEEMKKDLQSEYPGKKITVKKAAWDMTDFEDAKLGTGITNPTEYSKEYLKEEEEYQQRKIKEDENIEKAMNSLTEEQIEKYRLEYDNLTKYDEFISEDNLFDKYVLPTFHERLKKNFPPESKPISGLDTLSEKETNTNFPRLPYFFEDVTVTQVLEKSNQYYTDLCFPTRTSEGYSLMCTRANKAFEAAYPKLDEVTAENIGIVYPGPFERDNKRDIEYPWEHVITSAQQFRANAERRLYTFYPRSRPVRIKYSEYLDGMLMRRGVLPETDAHNAAMDEIVTQIDENTLEPDFVPSVHVGFGVENPLQNVVGAQPYMPFAAQERSYNIQVSKYRRQKFLFVLFSSPDISDEEIQELIDMDISNRPAHRTNFADVDFDKMEEDEMQFSRHFRGYMKLKALANVD